MHPNNPDTNYWKRPGAGLGFMPATAKIQYALCEATQTGWYAGLYHTHNHL